MGTIVRLDNPVDALIMYLRLKALTWNEASNVKVERLQ